MKTEYDFSEAKRGALIPAKGKSRITIYIDNAVLDEFRARAEDAGTGYQTMMNEALKAYLAQTEPAVTETALRRILREELTPTAAASRTTSPGDRGSAPQRRRGSGR